MKLWSRLFLAGIAGFVVLQFIRPGIPAKPATAEIMAPVEVKQILQKDCYSCHSNERRLSWFDEVVPAYWLVRRDILTAREHINFSTLGSKPAAVQRGTLFEAVNMMQLGAMPLPQFVRLHPEATVTASDLETLKAYLAPWSTPIPNVQAAKVGAAAETAAVSLDSVAPEWNGLAFDSSFEGWKLVSTTDRGDNNTFRFILGNDIAIGAMKSGKMTPWPDGTRFAKIAWQQQANADGLVEPGPFVQVELMVKDASQYKATNGWGWGRWRGLDLKPYGSSARFVGECTTCHLPVAGNDDVYTLPITPAELNGSEIVNNRAAALPAGLPYQPLGWGAITMFVDRRKHTTATLYGNDAAMSAVHFRPGTGQAEEPKYPQGAVLALVTWAQRDDPHWFGARIPDSPLTVELVDVAGAGQANKYRRFGGGVTDDAAEKDATQRSAFLLGLIPVRLP